MVRLTLEEENGFAMEAYISGTELLLKMREAAAGNGHRLLSGDK